MKMLLDDEEIKGKWHTTSYEPADNQISYSLNDIRDRILKAQLKKVASLIWEVQTGIGRGSGRVSKANLQALLKEVEE